MSGEIKRTLEAVSWQDWQDIAFDVATHFYRKSFLMPDYTTTEAAEYLAARGFTVHSKRDGTDRPPPSELIKRWCMQGKIKARKSGWVWLISREELERILEPNVASNVAREPGADTPPQHNAE